MKRNLLPILFLYIFAASCSPKTAPTTFAANNDRPKLVVGVVIDQMRWDYLYRYYERYGSGGFKRLMNDGFNCQNTMISYIPSYTAPGHAGIYTGSVPSVNGIAANNWVDNLTGREWYCAEDTTVTPVGCTGATGLMSPRNLITTTVTDELKLATNMRARVYGVSIKDRGAIFPAGHLANGAYWYDDATGNFCSSSYYSNSSPAWLQSFNGRHVPDSLLNLNWNLLYNADTYTQSTADDSKYEGTLKKEKAPVFPHITDGLKEKDKYGAIRVMPAGNTLSVMMAKACAEGEHLGQGSATDFLCLSLSSTDYAGHNYGPNAMEIEDMYLRLDNEIAGLLSYLDNKVGKGNYLFFLTADHGAAHNATYLTDMNVPAGTESKETENNVNAYLKSIYNTDKLVAHYMNYQLYLNEGAISAAKLDRDKVKNSIMEWMNKRPEVSYIIDMERMEKTAIPEPIRTMVTNGYYHLRSGCMQVILNPAWYEASRPTGTTHGTWNPYDAHIPLLWYGWHIPAGETHETVRMCDIAPTVAALLHIQMPNGNVGTVIKQIKK